MSPQDDTSAATQPPSDPAPVQSVTPTAVAGARPNEGADGRALPHPAERLLEQFAHEYLRERRSTRRWNRMIRIGWLAVFGLAAWGLFAQNRHSTTPTTPHTALVELRGEIAADTEASAEFMLSGIKSAFEDTGAQAVVIRINSPGGSPVQAGIIHDELLRLKAKHNKQVYAVVEESCASGAYYVAVAADAIYVDKASVVGSIGVLMDGFGFTGLMDKLGIERRLLTAGRNKGLLDPFSPVSEAQRAHVQATLDQIHRQFIDVVKQGRGARLKEDENTFSGLFWNGEEAVKLGLADALGNLDYVAREVVKAEEIIDYTPKENVAERLAKRFGASMGAGAVRAMRELPALN
jgi:protease IV